MARKKQPAQTAESMGYPSSGNKGDNKPIVHRIVKGGGKVNADKHGHMALTARAASDLKPTTPQRSRLLRTPLVFCV